MKKRTSPGDCSARPRIRKRQSRDGSDAGPTGYAREAAQTDGQVTAAELRADATGAITAFLDVLEAKEA